MKAADAVSRNEVVNGYLGTHSLWCVFPTECPSFRYFIKVIIVPIVVLLSPVVTEAGCRIGARGDWT